MIRILYSWVWVDLQVFLYCKNKTTKLTFQKKSVQIHLFTLGVHITLHQLISCVSITVENMQMGSANAKYA